MLRSLAQWGRRHAVALTADCTLSGAPQRHGVPFLQPQHADAEAVAATAQALWPASLPSSPYPPGPVKRETTSPTCSTTATPNFNPPWLGQPIPISSLLSWHRHAQHQQPSLPELDAAAAALGVSRNGFPPAQPHLEHPSGGGVRPRRTSHTSGSAAIHAGRPQRPDSSAEKEDSRIPVLSAGAPHQASKSKHRAVKIVARGTKSKAAGAALYRIDTQGASREAVKRQSREAVSPTRTGRMRWPSKRSLDAADGGHLDDSTGTSSFTSSCMPKQAVFSLRCMIPYQQLGAKPWVQEYFELCMRLTVAFMSCRPCRPKQGSAADGSRSGKRRCSEAATRCSGIFSLPRSLQAQVLTDN